MSYKLKHINRILQREIEIEKKKNMKNQPEIFSGMIGNYYYMNKMEMKMKNEK